MAVKTALCNGGLATLQTAIRSAGVGSLYLAIGTGQGASITTTSASIAALATTFTATSAAGLSVGQMIQVDTGSISETKKITVVSGTTITVDSAFVNAHSSGVNVYQSVQASDSAMWAEDTTTGRTAVTLGQKTTTQANDTMSATATPTFAVTSEYVTELALFTALTGGTMIAHSAGYYQQAGTGTGTSSAQFEIDLQLQSSVGP